MDLNHLRPEYVIRPELPEEFPTIYALVKEAFRTAQVSDGDEQDFVDRLRAGDGYIPELALVAEKQRKLIGHVMLTQTELADGTRLLLLAPLSVAPEYRNRGIGAGLTHEVLRRAKHTDYSAVVLVGNPAYYSRFGFRQSTDYGIRNTNGIPDIYVQALELTDNALAGLNTTITFQT
ncbi:N-acetyltransferase [uncultured Alistipes sp.]|jgi:acetyltransferase, GNAT family|uniref:GNAT family N-acetyltransferase n=1 Tax=uncultured Alistipes sp. TaxID=538949 RepID=UPI0025FAA15F|nr:N-acetyltransferase [uncultured Alistipes sp.]